MSCCYRRSAICFIYLSRFFWVSSLHLFSFFVFFLHITHCIVLPHLQALKKVFAESHELWNTSSLLLGFHVCAVYPLCITLSSYDYSTLIQPGCGFVPSPSVPPDSCTLYTCRTDHSSSFTYDNPVGDGHTSSDGEEVHNALHAGFVFRGEE